MIGSQLIKNYISLTDMFLQSEIKFLSSKLKEQNYKFKFSLNSIWIFSNKCITGTHILKNSYLSFQIMLGSESPPAL